MALVLAGFTLVALIDLIPMIRRRSGRAAAAFFVLFVPALALAVLQSIKIEVPSIMTLLGTLLKALGISY
jgi:Mg/Co/Ni transporter MgtE